MRPPRGCRAAAAWPPRYRRVAAARRRYDDTAATFRLLGEDCYLLEVLLQTLAVLLRGASPHPCARSMARALFEFCWTLRHHEEVAVRRGVLVGLGAVGDSLLPAVLVQELGGALPALQEWLRATAQDESDVGCLQLAAACHSLFGNKIRMELSPVAANV